MELADDAHPNPGLSATEDHPTAVTSARSPPKAGLLSLETYSPLTRRAHRTVPYDRSLDPGLPLTAAIARLHCSGFTFRRFYS
jgi:hypothetical protein